MADSRDCAPAADAHEEALRQGDRQIAEIHAVLARIAPNESAEYLGRVAQMIALSAVVASAGQLAGSRRGTAPALKNLAAVDRKIQSLARQIAELGADEVLALHRSGAPLAPDEFLSALMHMQKKVGAAYDTLNKGLPRPTIRNRLPNTYVDSVARLAASTYIRLTGKRPTRETDRDTHAPIGAFDAFLTGIFNALEIEASAEHYIRKMYAERR